LEDFFQKLRSIQKKERANSSLSRINNDFYKKVRDFIDDLKESIANDPFSEENHTLKKSIPVITEIYEKREHKIANIAIMNIHRSYHLFSGAPQFDFLDTAPLNLAPEEEKLYFSIIETLKIHRERISKDVVNENIEFSDFNPQNTEINNFQGSKPNKPIIKQSSNSKAFSNINKNEQIKISNKLYGIKKAKIIENEKRESIDSQIYKSKNNHKIESKTNNTNNDMVLTNENVLNNKDTINKNHAQHLNSNDLKKSNSINPDDNQAIDDKHNKSFSLIKDNGNKKILDEHKLNEHVFKDQNEQFPVFEDDEEKYFNSSKNLNSKMINISKTHKKEPKIIDPIVIEPILFFDNLPPIMGVDSKVYGPFRPQDVATIPITNAEIIVKNKKGRLLKI
jgi:DNA replication factor GINS